jgi:hypothetical protein
MIRGKWVNFEKRFVSRGYTLDQVQECIVERDGEYVTVDETHPAYPHPKRGLGDMVADSLAAIGITKERVSKAIGKPCGCSKRQQKLNELGRQFGIG